jgi:hypothetical protein
LRCTAASFNEWMEVPAGFRRRAPSTMRNYQKAVTQFCDVDCSPHYGWVQEYEARFATHPTQVCHDWNTTRHVKE